MAGVLNISSKFVFIHVPRCAGASITKVLMKNDQSTNFRDISGLKEIVIRENRDSPESVNLHHHARARDIMRYLGDDVYANLVSFTVVRNPWERLKSRFQYFKARPGHPVFKYADGSLEKFVVWACEHRPSSMQERLTDRSGRVIVKHILKYESLHQDFHEFGRTLPIEIGELPHVNASKRCHVNFQFPRRVLDLVVRTFAQDFSLFEYPTDPPENWLWKSTNGHGT